MGYIALVGESTSNYGVSEQGAKMGRRSLLHVRITGNKQAEGIYVGGHVTAIAEGRMRL